MTFIDGNSSVHFDIENNGSTYRYNETFSDDSHFNAICYDIQVAVTDIQTVKVVACDGLLYKCNNPAVVFETVYISTASNTTTTITELPTLTAVTGMQSF